MHPEVKKKKAGRCSICKMELVLESSVSSGDVKEESYKPLLVIVSLILIVSLAISYKDGFLLSSLVSNFMIGFFLIFGGFKLMDLKGFAQGYSMYDLLAQRFYGYGYIYPFIEIFFGLAMIIGFWMKELLIAEIAAMSFSGIGVVVKLIKKEKFQCACLGTFLKVPLTYVTLIEDFGMAILAFLMLYLG